MIIYNVTINIDSDVHEEWLKWMKEEHIPDVMGTGLFTENRFCRVLVDEEAGVTYSVQYSARTMEDYERYRDEFSKTMQQRASDKFKGKFVAFRTLLELV